MFQKRYKNNQNMTKYVQNCSENVTKISPNLSICWKNQIKEIIRNKKYSNHLFSSLIPCYTWIVLKQFSAVPDSVFSVEHNRHVIFALSLRFPQKNLTWTLTVDISRFWSRFDFMEYRFCIYLIRGFQKGITCLLNNSDDFQVG